MYNRQGVMDAGIPLNNLGLDKLSEEALQQRVLELTMLVSDAQASITAIHCEMRNREARERELQKRIDTKTTPEQEALLAAAGQQ